VDFINNWAIIAYDEVGSTNDIARKHTFNSSYPYFVVTARRQTSGRGRRGRNWISISGNLFMSQCFQLNTQHLSDAVFLVSLSLQEAIISFAPQGKTQLKWPNDVLIENKKISGILLEKGENGYIIAGIGINISAAPTNDTNQIYPVASLSDFGVCTNCQEVLKAYIHAFDKNYALWQRHGFAPIKDKWLKYAKGLFKEIVVNLEHGQEVGIFAGISDKGALLLRQGDKIKQILAGDIFYKEENKINE